MCLTLYCDDNGISYCDDVSVEQLSPYIKPFISLPFTYSSCVYICTVLLVSHDLIDSVVGWAQASSEVQHHMIMSLASLPIECLSSKWLVQTTYHLLVCIVMLHTRYSLRMP